MLYRYCSADGTVDEPPMSTARRNHRRHRQRARNVLGMMPHPENHVEDIMGCTDGRGLFEGLVAHLGACGVTSAP